MPRATLHRALAGSHVVRFESVFPALTRVHDDHPLTDMTIERIESVGKHLLMHFSGGLVLRTHMRMNGSWHIYRPGERWQRSARDMRVVVATSDFEAVGFNIPVAEFIATRDLAKHKILPQLGPDPLDAHFDRAEAVRRLRARPSLPIADALLDQRADGWDRQRLQVGGAVLLRHQPVRAGRDARRRQLEGLVDTARKMLRPTSRRLGVRHDDDRGSAGRQAATIRTSVSGSTAARGCRAVDAARR